MKLYQVLKQEMEAENLTQSELAKAANCSQVMISNYLAGINPMPLEAKIAVTKYINTFRTNRALSNELKLGILNIELLDNVDTNAIVILDSIIEESEEVIKASSILKKILKNKKSDDDLDNTDSKKMLGEVMQLSDLYFALDTFLAKMSEDFGISLMQLERVMNEKMKTKGYIRRN